MLRDDARRSAVVRLTWQGEVRSRGQSLPRIGGHWLVADGAGLPRCVVRSTELRVGRLDSVDDAFAWDEGEGDRSRDGWPAGHLRHVTRGLTARGGTWSDDLAVVFERFVVVWPPEVAR